MNRTKPLSIAIAASIVYVAWLSMSVSGALQQIEKSAFAQDINFPAKFVRVSSCEAHLSQARLKVRTQQQVAKTKPTQFN